MSNKRMATFTIGSVRSPGGTKIGFRRIGAGRPLVLVHGGLLASQHFVELATRLAPDFEVILPDRRGRGMSGPYSEGTARIVDQEAADIRTLIEHTGARDAFGLSSGALVLLEAAKVVDSMRKIALYEPPLSIGGSTPLGWVERYEMERAAGKTAAALITGMRGLGADPVMSRIPRIATPLLALLLRSEKSDIESVAIRDLVPTWHYDFAIIRETADQLAGYAGIRGEVLLMGGSKSPAFLARSLEALDEVLPDSRQITLRGLGHQAPVDQPERVAAVLRQFFGPSAA